MTATDDSEDRQRRRVLWALPSGLYVVGSRHGGEANLMTCNWIMQVATSPTLVGMAVEAGSVTRRLVESDGRFVVSLLARQDRALVRRFVKPVRTIERDMAGVITTMQGTPVVEVSGGLPRLETAVAWISCQVRSIVDWAALAPSPAGSPSSHVLIVGEVAEVGLTDRFAGLAGDEIDGTTGEDPSTERADSPSARAILSMADTRMRYGG